VPPLVLIFLVLGTIFFGIATPTEAGAMGAVGAMLLALANRRLTCKSLEQHHGSDGAPHLDGVHHPDRGDRLRHGVHGAARRPRGARLPAQPPGRAVGFIFFSMLVIFVLGFFIDFIEITFIVVPLLAPIALAFFGHDLMVWFGVLIAMNLQASFLTPPFGFALFYLKGVSPPSIKTHHIYKGRGPVHRDPAGDGAGHRVVPALVTYLPELARASAEAAANAPRLSGARERLARTVATHPPPEAARSGGGHVKSVARDQPPCMKRARRTRSLAQPRISLRKAT
jgi:hypothetical protein